jgi:hypothetical protein
MLAFPLHQTCTACPSRRRGRGMRAQESAWENRSRVASGRERRGASWSPSLERAGPSSVELAVELAGPCARTLARNAATVVVALTNALERRWREDTKRNLAVTSHPSTLTPSCLASHGQSQPSQSPAAETTQSKIRRQKTGPWPIPARLTMSFLVTHRGNALYSVVCFASLSVYECLSAEVQLSPPCDWKVFAIPGSSNLELT